LRMPAMLIWNSVLVGHPFLLASKIPSMGGCLRRPIFRSVMLLAVNHLRNPIFWFRGYCECLATTAGSYFVRNGMQEGRRLLSQDRLALRLYKAHRETLVSYAGKLSGDRS